MSGMDKRPFFLHPLEKKEEPTLSRRILYNGGFEIRFRKNWKDYDDHVSLPSKGKICARLVSAQIHYIERQFYLYTM